MERPPERRPQVFSIDPYIDAGGNFGAQIELNQTAAEKIYKAAAFTRDIYVGKRQATREREIDAQSDELVMKRFAFPKLTTRSTPLHDLEATETAFFINVDDEALSENADERVKSVYKKHGDLRGQDILRSEFLKMLNEEAASGLNEALYRERVSLRNHYLDYIMAFVAVYCLYQTTLGGPSFYSLMGLGGSSSILGLRIWDSSSIEAMIYNRQEAGSDSRFSEPIFSPHRISRGYWQIMRNQGKIIIERDSPTV